MSSRHVCGFECRATPIDLHWSSVNNAGSQSLETTIVAPGGSTVSLRIITTNSTSYVQENISGSPTAVGYRFKFRFNGSLPSGTATLLEIAASSGNRAQLFWGGAGVGVQAKFSVAGTVSAATVVAVDTWYTVDFRIELNNAGSRTINWSLDGSAKPSLSVVEASSTLTTLSVGMLSSRTVNMCLDDSHLTDWADYPLGDSSIIGRRPNRDGAHIISAVTDFQQNGADLSTTAPTTTWQSIDNDITSTIGTFVGVTGASATEWLEWGFEPMPSNAGAIKAVELVTTHHSSAAAANKQSLWLRDNTTDAAYLTDVSVPQTTIASGSARWTLSPNTGLAFTKAQVDALLMRWNSSRTTPDTTPVPILDAAILEVDYVPVNVSAALSGTALSAMTESDVRAGGKTIIIDLTGGTWIAP